MVVPLVAAFFVMTLVVMYEVVLKKWLREMVAESKVYVCCKD